MNRGRLRNTLPFFKEIYVSWAESKAPRLGAALAFYTIFAVAPLFLIALAIAGFCFGEEAARRELFGQLHGMLGEQGGEAVQSLVAAANRPKAGLVATVMAIVALCAGSTGAFVELQDALNTIWRVEPRTVGGIRHFIRSRLLSFAMVLGIGFLLLVSLVLSAALAALGVYAAGFVPGQKILLEAFNFLVSFAVITSLFAMIFKILPDVRLSWRDVWIGAGITGLLFNFGKFLIGLYLGHSSLASAYGAAGSLLILLLWVYYSAQIVFFGAEFTRVYAQKYGSHSQAQGGNGAESVSSSHGRQRRKLPKERTATRVVRS